MAKGLSEEQKQQMVGLFKTTMTNREIARLMGCSERSVRAVKVRYRTRQGNISRKKGQGRKASKVTKANIDIVKKRVARNPKRSMRAMAKSLEMSPRSMGRLVKKAGLKSMGILVVHDIMPGQEARRLERARALLQWRAKRKNRSKTIIWSDEKLFYV